LRWGVPIAEKESISFGLGYDSTNVTLFDDSRRIYKEFVQKFGNDNSSILLSSGWSRDTKDSLIYPTSGGYTRVGAEVSTPGGTLRYYRATAQHQRYFPLSKTFTLMVNGELGIANGYGNRDLPFYKNFYAGGVTSVRGYQQSSLGPQQDGEAIGGQKRVLLNTELLFPFPGSGVDKSLRLSWFVDAGQVFGSNDDYGRYEKLSLSELRYSTGLALAWTSPLGPLKFGIANPLNKKDGDKTQRFQFQFGTVF